MAIKNQVGLNLSDEQLALVEGWVKRFGKKSKAQVFMELLERYGVAYEELEEDFQQRLKQQRSALGGKVQAERSPPPVPKRKQG